MDWLTPAVVATLSGSVVLTFVYGFLYARDRQLYLGVWTLAWLAHVVRYALSLIIRLSGQTPVLLFGNQWTVFASSILILWGTYSFLNRRMPRWWIAVGAVGTAWIAVAIALNLSFLALTVPTFTFLGFANIWTGIAFLRARNLAAPERHITGWALIAWGLHRGDYPYLRPVAWFAPWGYLLAAILELVVALGFLLTTLGQTRKQLGAAEERVWHLAENAPDLVYRYRLLPTPGFEYVSPSATQMTGYTPEEHYADPELGTKIVHPDDAPLLGSMLSGSRIDPGPVVLRWRRKDGRIIWTEQHNVLVRNPAGHTIAIEGIARDVTDRMQAEQARREQHDFAEALVNVATALNSTLALDEVLERILANLERVVPSDAANIMFIEGGTARVVRGRGYEGRGGEKVMRALHFSVADYPIMRNVVGSGEPAIIDDTRLHPGWVDHKETRWVRSMVGVPIKVGNRVVGLLTLDSASPGFFTQAHAQRLQAFALQAAIALQNARLYEMTSRRAKRLELVSHIARQTSAILQRDELLVQAVKLIGETFDYRTTEIWLVEEDALILNAAFPPAPQTVRAVRLRVGAEDSIIGWVAGSAQHVLCPDVRQEPRYRALSETRATLSELAVPIVVGGVVIGVINVESTEQGAFTEADTFTLGTIADELAIGIRNAELYQALEEHRDRLEQRIEERTLELRQEKERAEAILRGAADIVLFADHEGVILSANRAFEEHSGYRLADVVGQHSRLLYDPMAASSSLDSMRKALAAGQPWRGETRLRRKDGSVFEAELNTAPLHDDDGEVRAFVSVIRDITSQKEVARLKDAFISNVSHELRTPISALKLYHALLRDGDPETRERYLDVLDRETVRLELIIEDLLRLSRLDQAQVDLNRKPVDLNALASVYVADRAPLAEEHGLSLTLEPTPGLYPVHADEGLVGQILSILLTNALNYTPRGGRVVVKTLADSRPSCDGSQWVGFSVADSGPGIPLSEQDMIFERFYRGRSGRAGGTPGTGLGLAIAREIALRHAGRIEVESEGVPGKGATFSVWLPLAEE